MENRRLILTIFYKHKRGGYCRRLYMLIETLLKEGYEVHYIAAEPLKLAPHPLLFPHLITFLPTRRTDGFWFWTFFTLLAPLYLIYFAISKRPFSIPVFDTYYSVLSKPASLICSAPLILFLRAVPWRITYLTKASGIPRIFRDSIDYIGLLFATRIVSVTTTMRDEIVTRHPKLARKIVTLPNTVIFPSELRVQEDGRINKDDWTDWMSKFPLRKKQVTKRFAIPEKYILLATSGELNNRKNIDHLVRAIGASRDERISLVICGDGPEKAAIAAIIAGLGLHDQVTFAGWLEEPGDVIAGCDILVMPSKHEGMSNSMLEAIGAGVPVIAADTPEMREVLQRDELLFDPSHVGKLAARLEKIAKNKAEVEKLRELLNDRARLFTFDWGRGVIPLLGKEG